MQVERQLQVNLASCIHPTAGGSWELKQGK
jgi:hypothetical protein